jgi:hypothetical protein
MQICFLVLKKARRKCQISILGHWGGEVSGIVLMPCPLKSNSITLVALAWLDDGYTLMDYSNLEPFFYDDDWFAQMLTELLNWMHDSFSPIDATKNSEEVLGTQGVCFYLIASVALSFSWLELHFHYSSLMVGTLNFRLYHFRCSATLLCSQNGKYEVLKSFQLTIWARIC